MEVRKTSKAWAVGLELQAGRRAVQKMRLLATHEADFMVNHVGASLDPSRPPAMQPPATLLEPIGQDG